MLKVCFILYFINILSCFAGNNNPFAPPVDGVIVKEVTDLQSAKVGDQVSKIEQSPEAKENIKFVSSAMPSLEAKIQGWYIMSTKVKDRKVCYMIKYPDEKVSNHKDSRKPYIMISFINSRRYEISISSGYKYRNNSVLNLSIDGIVFKLSANNNIAWSQGIFDDFAILHTMTNSFRAMASSESSFGTYAVDTYDLVGFKEAYDKMVSVCLK